MLKKVILWFDVEDYVTPEAEDSLYELLKLMNRHGVRATLKFCEKKYQQLIDHGRTDILKLIADHELAFHMTDHSVHPIPSEYLDRMGFKEGALDFDRREGPGYLALREKSGQPLSSYGHPGVAGASQMGHSHLSGCTRHSADRWPALLVWRRAVPDQAEQPGTP